MALIVGIEDYTWVGAEPGAVRNADDWYLWLGTARGLPLVRAVVLRDDDATRERMLEEARLAAGRVREGGTLWFVFIDHGAPSRDGRRGCCWGWTPSTGPTASTRAGCCSPRCSLPCNRGLRPGPWP